MISLMNKVNAEDTFENNVTTKKSLMIKLTPRINLSIMLLRKKILRKRTMLRISLRIR